MKEHKITGCDTIYKAFRLWKVMRAWLCKDCGEKKQHWEQGRCIHCHYAGSK